MKNQKAFLIYIQNDLDWTRLGIHAQEFVIKSSVGPITQNIIWFSWSYWFICEFKSPLETLTVNKFSELPTIEQFARECQLKQKKTYRFSMDTRTIWYSKKSKWRLAGQKYHKHRTKSYFRSVTSYSHTKYIVKANIFIQNVKRILVQMNLRRRLYVLYETSWKISRLKPIPKSLSGQIHLELLFVNQVFNLNMTADHWVTSVTTSTYHRLSIS